MSDEDEGLTEDQYFAQVRLLGLFPTDIRTEKHTIHSTVDGNAVPVPNPEHLTPCQRKAAIEEIKRHLGIGFPGYHGPH